MERLLREKCPEHLNSSRIVCLRQFRAGSGTVLLEERGTTDLSSPLCRHATLRSTKKGTRHTSLSQPRDDNEVWGQEASVNQPTNALSWYQVDQNGLATFLNSA